MDKNQRDIVLAMSSAVGLIYLTLYNPFLLFPALIRFFANYDLIFMKAVFILQYVISAVIGIYLWKHIKLSGVFSRFFIATFIVFFIVRLLNLLLIQFGLLNLIFRV